MKRKAALSQQYITLCAGRSRSLFSLMTFHISWQLNENPEAGTTPRRSPASPPGAMEWWNRCRKLATYIQNKPEQNIKQCRHTEI